MTAIKENEWEQLNQPLSITLPDTPEENLKLVVFDLDGTVVTPEFSILDSTVDAIQAIRDAGYRVTVATGRSYKSAKPFLDAMKIIEPMVFSNGSVFDNPETGEREVITGIPLETALIVVMLLKEIPISLKVHLSDGTIYKSDTTPWPDEGVHFEVGEITENIASILDEDPVKIVFHGDQERIEQLANRLADILGDKQSVRLFRSHTNYMEMTHKNVSKGDAVRLLVHKLGLSMKNVIAVGDMENDLEMIRDAAIGILAGQGTPKLREVTPYRIPSPQDKGIEKLSEWLTESNAGS